MSSLTAFRPARRLPPSPPPRVPPPAPWDEERVAGALARLDDELGTALFRTWLADAQRRPALLLVLALAEPRQAEVLARLSAEEVETMGKELRIYLDVATTQGSHADARSPRR